MQVVSNAVRQLQNLVTDEAAVECHELFLSESKSSATGGTCSTAYDRLIPELIYQKKAEKLLADENCMKIFIVSADPAAVNFQGWEKLLLNTNFYRVTLQVVL